MTPEQEIDRLKSQLNDTMLLVCRDAGTIGFLTGVLECLRYQVSADVRAKIDSALKQVAEREGRAGK